MIHSRKSHHVLEAVEDIDAAVDERILFEAPPEKVQCVRLILEKLRTQIEEAIDVPESDRESDLEKSLEKIDRMLRDLNVAISKQEDPTPNSGRT